MSHIPPIPLLRAGVVLPLLQEARSEGVPVRRLLERFGIPEAVEEDPLLVVPELPLWRFVEAMVRCESGPLFGLRAGLNMPQIETPSLLPLLQNSLNLKGLLVQFCAAAPTQSNVSRYSLREEGDLVWIEESAPPLIPDCPGVVLYDVMGMIQVVRLAVGEDWKPPVISLSCSRRAEIETAPELNPSRILFRQASRGIAVPRRLLPMPVVFPAGKQSVAGEIPGDLTSLIDFPSQLQKALSPYLSEASLSIGYVARSLDISVRTLQRCLAGANTSWSRVLERARFLKAQELLQESDLKIEEIAWEVGYSHSSTFCQSFRRLAGLSPSECRRYFGGETSVGSVRLRTMASPRSDAARGRTISRSRRTGCSRARRRGRSASARTP